MTPPDARRNANRVAVELRHLGKRWFLIETRKGDSGLWVSAFTADFTH
jgi:hypothetical protein